MKIVLAIDGSDFGKMAVVELARMPLPSKTEVCILNVVEDHMLATPEALSNVRKLTEDIVNDASKSLIDKNGAIAVTTAVVSGIPKSAILEKAETFGADLIVVGSQGDGALSRFLLGSVSQSVAMYASCSVLIVRKPGSENEK